MTILNKTAFVLCGVVIVFTTMAYGGVHQPVIALFYLLVVIAAVALAVDRFRSGKLRFRTDKLQLPLVIAAIYAFIQIIPFGTFDVTSQPQGIPRTISLDPFSTWSTALQLTALWTFFLVLLSSLDSASRIRGLFNLIAIFGFIFAFFAILQSVLSPDKIYGIYDVSFGSPFGSFVNRNDFAAFMEMSLGLPLGLVFIGAVSKDKRLLFITAIVLMGVALMLSRSRGGLVAFIAEILLLFFLTRQSTTRKAMLLRAGSIVLLIIAVVAGAIFVGGDTSLTRMTETAASEDLSTMRSHIWSVSTKVINENLPFGTGFGAFAVAYTQFDNSSGLARVEQAHNDYLQIVTDAGIPGLLIGLLFLFLFLRNGTRIAAIKNTFRRGIALGAFAGCFAVLIHSFFDFALHINAVALLFLSLLALLSASQQNLEDDIEDVPRLSKRKRSGRVKRVESVPLLR